MIDGKDDGKYCRSELEESLGSECESGIGSSDGIFCGGNFGKLHLEIHQGNMMDIR